MPIVMENMGEIGRVKVRRHLLFVIQSFYKICTPLVLSFFLQNICFTIGCGNTLREAWAREKCHMIMSPVFEACHNEVDPQPYHDRCVFDACSCDQGGDCECLCTAIAVYSQV